MMTLSDVFATTKSTKDTKVTGSGRGRAQLDKPTVAPGASEFIQIGRTLKSNSRIPVIRERRALDDIIFSPDIKEFINSVLRFVDVGRSGVIQPQEVNMGRQIRFYMVEEDEDEFLAYVQSTDDAGIMLSTSTSEEGDILSSFKDLLEIKPSRNYYLWNRSISPKPSLKYVPQQNYYFLNFMDSEVVDVMRSKRSQNTLSMGRLHIETTCFNSEGNVVKKSDVFLSWYDSLCRWIRKNCPEKFDGAYVSSRVSELVASGVELVGHRM